MPLPNDRPIPHRLARVFHLPTVARARQPVTRHGVKPGSCPAASPLRIASPTLSSPIQPMVGGDAMG
ncbi:MAG: hypothetical protein M5U34_08360 [Chloroflexi bacterium]|nr:hypothetical protein [Chloroflexota bacterium]